MFRDCFRPYIVCKTTRFLRIFGINQIRRLLELVFGSRKVQSNIKIAQYW